MRRGFSLVELLVSVALIAALVSLLLPGLSAARRQAARVKCAANLHQLGVALHMYASEYRGRAMPLAYTDAAVIGAGPQVYWWGTNTAGAVDHTRGFVWPYLRADLRPAGLYECPAMPWGSYAPQGAARAVTSTYGYNGYYLCPPHTPAWSAQIGHRPWQSLDTLPAPQRVFAFADAALDFGGPRPHNNALLDPPQLYSRGRWSPNPSPTTSFRHDGRTSAAFVDGHVAAQGLSGGRLTSTRFHIGSAGAEPGPHYVPDWREW